MRQTTHHTAAAPLNGLEALLVKTLLPQEAQRQYAAGAVARRELQDAAKWLRRLSQDYIEKGAQAPAGKLPREAARAYALYYLPINFEKLFRLLCLIKDQLPAGRLRVLDFGCGPGTGSLAAVSALGRPLSITACDQSGVMLELAAEIFNSWEPGAASRFSDCHAPPLDQRFDLIIAANVISELLPASLKARLEDFHARLDRHGVLLLLEPGQAPHTRALMTLRDELLGTHNDWSPIYPCTHAGPCPMLADSPNDWCHGTLAWDPPRLVRALDEITGFNKHRLKFSALILQKDAAAPAGSRIVKLIRSGQGRSLLLCGPSGYKWVLAKEKGGRSAKHFDVV